MQHNDTQRKAKAAYTVGFSLGFMSVFIVFIGFIDVFIGFLAFIDFCKDFHILSANKYCFFYNVFLRVFLKYSKCKVLTIF